MQKIWTFVKNGNSPPATLMDVPEGVVCVVNMPSLQEVLPPPGTQITYTNIYATLTEVK